MTRPSKKQITIILFLTIVVLGVQLTAIGRPYTGHFASYQATVMASISRNMLRENFSDLLNPKTDALLTSDARLLHLNQYPFPSVLAAAGIRFFGGTLEFWGRFQAVLFNFLTILLLGMLAARLFNPATGWITAMVYSLSPFTLIYGQSFMSEPSSLFLLILSFFLLLKPSGQEPGMVSILGSAVCFSMACTGRLHLILFYPLHVYLLACGKGKRKLVKLLLFTIFASSLPVLWYSYTYFRALQTEDVHSNLFAQLGMARTDAPSLLSLAYLRRIFRIAEIMLTPLLNILFIAGLFLIPKKGRGFYFAFGGLLLGGLILFLSPQKVMRHDFYLYGFFPFVVLATACGIHPWITRFPGLNRTPLILAGLILYLGFSARYFVHPIFKGNAAEEQAIQTAVSVKEMTKPEDNLIVAGTHTPLFLYYVDRPAWNMDLNAIGKPLAAYLKNTRFLKREPGELEALETAMKNPRTWFEYLRQKGAAYLVTTNKKELEAYPEFLSYLRQTYAMASNERDDFYCFRLRTFD